MDADLAIIGGGVTGLAAAVRARHLAPRARIEVLEATVRPGGKVSTVHQGGVVFEEGPDSFLSAKPAGIALVRGLGLESRLVGTLPGHPRAFIKRQARLRPFPEGLSGLVPARLGPLLRGGTLSPLGILRAACEPLIPRRAGAGDESVAAFVRRRFGRETYERLVEPLLGGVYAGDGDQLSLTATLPRLRQAEVEHGSVLRAVRRAPDRSASALPSFVSFPGGMGELVDALAAALTGTELRLGIRIVSVTPIAEGFRLRDAAGATLDARAVLFAIPAMAAAELLVSLEPEAVPLLGSIPHADAATVSLAFDRRGLRSVPQGHGYLAARGERGPAVAVTFTSNKFPGRAPAGLFLARVFLGRAGETLADDETVLARAAQAELADTVGLTASPAQVRVRRWPGGLPQYTVGHGERLGRLRELLARWRGLAIAGASFDGVGIPDCIASGEGAAEALMAQLGGR